MLLFPDAKINLGLNVIARRPDGYHEIITVMIPVPSTDILEVVPSPDGQDTLHCSGRPVICPPESNLVFKALNKMRRYYDVHAVNVFLNKQTPDGAGLGGGSADAAFMLKALNKLFNLGATDNILAGIAAEVGADCPFFIYNRPMLCTGTGTDMVPADIELPSPLWIALVKPDVSVPTREAYAMLVPHKPEHHIMDILKTPVTEWQGRLTNDFEEGITARHPVIGRIKQKLIQIGAVYASMSGSGSAVYGLFTHTLSPEEIKPLGCEGCYLFSKIK